MSIHTWGVCPICHNLLENWRGGIDHLYGDVPYEDFKKIEKEYNKLLKIDTVREDFEANLNEDGSARVYFSAKCETCGAEWGFIEIDVLASPPDQP